MSSTVYIVERIDFERSDIVASYSDPGIAEAHAERENRKQYDAYLAQLRSEIARWETYAAENPPSELEEAVFEIQDVERNAKTPGPRRAARAVLATLPTDLARLHDVRTSIADMRGTLAKASASFGDWATEHGEYRVYSLDVSDQLEPEQ